MKKILPLLAFTILLIGGGLTSCQNFLTGGEIKQQIEDEIARANAKKIDIRIAVDSPEYGSVYPTQVTVIKGDSFSIEFAKTATAFFNEWICVDSSTNMVLDDAVTFSNSVKNGNKYTVTATLNCESENLIIKPYCYLSTEENPPEFKTLRLAKTEEDAINGTNLISFDAFTHYATKTTYGGDTAKLAEGIREHHVNSLWVYVEADDDSSGVGQLIVEEKRIKDREANNVSEAGITTIFDNPSKSRALKNAYKFDFNASDDGVVQLSFSVKDRAGNSKEYGKNTDVIKDTSVGGSTIPVGLTPKIREKNSYSYTYNIPISVSFSGLFIKDMDGNEHNKVFTSTNDYDEKMDISIFWGYDKENMVAVDDFDIKNCPVKVFEMSHSIEIPLSSDYAFVTFTADTRKDVFLKVVSKDAAGNIDDSTINCISKAVNVLSCKQESDSWTLTLDGPFNAQILNSPTEGYWAPGLYIVYTDKNGNVSRPESIDLKSGKIKSTLTLTSLKYGNNTSSKRISDLPDGTYEIYCVPYYYDFPTRLAMFSGVAGKSCTVYKGVTPPASSTPTAADLPSSFTVSVDKAVKGTGMRTVHVSYPAGFTPNPNLTYVINYSHEENSYASSGFSGVTLEKDFEIPTHYCTWDFTICAYNSKGESVHTSPVSKALNNPKTDDNVSPKVNNLTLSKVTSNELVFTYTKDTLPFKDDNVGMYSKKPKGSGTFSYVTVQYTFSSERDFENKIDWTSDSIRSCKYADSFNTFKRTFTVPFDDLQGSYLYMRVRDKNRNYLVTCFSDDTSPVNLIEKGKITDENLKASSNTVNVSCEYNSNLKISVEYSSGNEWNKTSQMSTSDSLPMTYSNNKSVKGLEFTSEEKNTFVRANIFTSIISYPNSNVKQVFYYHPIYFCPAKYLDSEFRCRQKNYIEGNLGIDILSDKPILAHAFYSTNNLGDSYESWLSRGIEVASSVRCESSSFTYENDYLSGIPSGKYYTTIIHYADGTVYMMPVKQMHSADDSEED